MANEFPVLIATRREAWLCATGGTLIGIGFVAVAGAILLGPRSIIGLSPDVGILLFALVPCWCGMGLIAALIQVRHKRAPDYWPSALRYLLRQFWITAYEDRRRARLVASYSDAIRHLRKG